MTEKGDDNDIYVEKYVTLYFIIQTIFFIVLSQLEFAIDILSIPSNFSTILLGGSSLKCCASPQICCASRISLESEAESFSRAINFWVVVAGSRINPGKAVIRIGIIRIEF